MRGFLLAIVLFIVLFFTFLAGIGCGLLISGGTDFSTGDKVAVLRVDDVIMEDQNILESISKIRDEDQIKAVVVRINSPGGAVSPSQEIYSELLKLKEEMPVIASIGSVGASGGYYIACGAEKIFANPGSITGSIGVIAQFASYEKLLEWAKVDVEVIKSGKFKDIGSPFREMNEDDREYIQGLINNVYGQFKDAVAESRHLSKAEVDKVADGKIFSGEQAKQLKLVDELGTINDAVSAAGSMAGIEGEPDLVYYPKKKSALMELLESKINIPVLNATQSKSSFGLFYLVDIIH